MVAQIELALGPQGNQGIQGPQGIQGWQGPLGDIGYQGPQGFIGPQGIQGPQVDEYTLSAGRNMNVVTNSYLNSDEAPTNIVPLVLSMDSTLVGISLVAAVAAPWVAEVRIGGVLVTGAYLASSGLIKAYSGSYNINFNAGDGLQIYCNGTGINRPRVILWFKRR